MHLKLLPLVGFIGLIACNYTDQGDGTGTLLVEAEVAYTSSNDRMQFTVTVERDSQALDGVTVIIRDDDADTEFILGSLAPDTIGRYYLSVPLYRRYLQLQVEIEDDYLNAKLEGPAHFQITKPQQDARVSITDCGDKLKVTWRPEDGLAADRVLLWFEQASFEATILDDLGYYNIPIDEFQVGDETVFVERINEVTLAGGVSGSIFHYSYQLDNEFVFED